MVKVGVVCSFIWRSDPFNGKCRCRMQIVWVLLTWSSLFCLCSLWMDCYLAEVFHLWNTCEGRRSVEEAHPLLILSQSFYHFHTIHPLDINRPILIVFSPPKAPSNASFSSFFLGHPPTNHPAQRQEIQVALEPSGRGSSQMSQSVQTEFTFSEDSFVCSSAASCSCKLWLSNIWIYLALVDRYWEIYSY